MPARLRSCPTSCSTCTDTLTLVAVSAAARKRVAGAGSPAAMPERDPGAEGQHDAADRAEGRGLADLQASERYRSPARR